MSRSVSVRTPERVALLREMWPAGIPTEICRQRMNELPGDTIHTVEQVSHMASDIGVRRPKNGVQIRVAPKLLPEQEGKTWWRRKCLICQNSFVAEGSRFIRLCQPCKSRGVS